MQVTEVEPSRTTEMRRAVLRPSWAPGAVMNGDDDPLAVHLGALDENGAVLGACVLLPIASPHYLEVHHAWQLRGMATAEGRRGEGIGGAVLTAAVQAVRVRGATLLWCRARSSALAFYAAHAFVVDSAEYLEPQTGLPHHDMSRPV